jgi:hypothetical protein
MKTDVNLIAEISLYEHGLRCEVTAIFAGAGFYARAQPL